MPGTYSAEAILSVPELRGPRISPSGQQVAFWSDQTGRPEVWVANTSTTDVWQVTDGQLNSFVGIWDYIWIDDDHLLIHTPETNHEVTISTVPEGRQTRTFSIESDDRIRKAVSSNGRYLVWGIDGLYRLDLVTGVRETLAAGHGARGAIVTIGPNDEWVAWIADDPETDDIRTIVCQCRLDGSDFSVVTTADGSKVKPRGEIAWHQHRGQFVVRDGTHNRIGLHTPEDECVEWISRNDGIGAVVGFFDSEHILIKRSDGPLETVPVSEPEASTALFQDSEISWVDASGQGSAAVVTDTTPDEPQRLLWVTSEDASQTLHCPSFGPVTPNLESPEKLEYNAADGTKADAEIYHAATKPAPTVGVVYSPGNSVPGFPLAQTRGLEYFVRQGYTVVLAAIPSERLSEAVKDDQIAFGAWLCDRTWVDGDRVALFGTSAGGHDVANLLLTRENTPWQAGLVYNGIPDLLASQEHEPENPRFTKHLGAPDENPEAWIGQSPIEHVETGFDAPVRIHHGVDDSRIPIEQMRTFRDRLIEAGETDGEEFEYHELPDEGHGSHVVAQNARNLTMYVDFLNRRL